MSKESKRTKKPLPVNRVMDFLDEMEADLKQGKVQAWVDVVERIGTIGQLLSNSAQKAGVDIRPGQGNDPADELEAAYQDLQLQLIQVRQAVAQSIATYMQLEQQYQKSKDQAETWSNRAAIAAKQNNQELVDQARQRASQYVEAADQLQQQLLEQKQASANLRQQLTDAEATVQKAYTQKQVLHARHKAAQATILANELLNNFNPENAQSIIANLEKVVIASEAKAADGRSSGGKSESSLSAKFLSDTVQTLQSTIDAINRLEQTLEKHRKTDQ
jgi:phage shock protein A